MREREKEREREEITGASESMLGFFTREAMRGEGREGERERENKKDSPPHTHHP